MPHHQFESSDSRPWVRWWWLRGPFDDKDITEQLHWIKKHGFGGVELAWICPLWQGLDPEAAELPRWLGDEFCTLLCVTQQRCRELGLGCDFTFGSAWPFGGTIVPQEDSSQTLDGLARRSVAERVPSSWEIPDDCPVVNHLSAHALRNYAARMAPTFEKALKAGSTHTSTTPALFCDSWEIQKNRLWTESLWETFQERFGYDLRSVVDQINRDPQIRYDHRKLVGETVSQEFYATFTEICHQLGARSRIQCHGSPTDLLVSYAHADIPETEAILYNPHFSRIPASAAALAQKPVLSCETFTCLYGFKNYEYWRKEQVADLKLLADGLFAQGVNQIVWHGMPYNPLSSWPQEGDDRYCEFYASVHVGPNCAFREELPSFNSYLTQVSEILKRGQTHSRLAVYLPNEDEIVRGDVLAQEHCVPGSQDYAEMRYVTLPVETEGYAPLWISGPFLAQASIENGQLCYGRQRFQALYVDVEWLDYDALERMLDLAQQGLPIVLKRKTPKQPGHSPRNGYDALLEELKLLAKNNLSEVSNIHPLFRKSTEVLPWFWARQEGSSTWVFLAHPKARDLKYPMTYGQSHCDEDSTYSIDVEVDTSNGEGNYRRVRLEFPPYQSQLLVIQGDCITFQQFDYVPPPAILG